jgi:aerobic carbon-monoxide dehydrogenase small subunit
MHISLTVNGRPQTAEVEPRRLLVDVLRETFGLTGTKVGCETGRCGACTILMDGVAVKSCLVLAMQADGSTLVTIEGLAQDGQLDPLQQAFQDMHGVQCGFCTPGLVMSLTELLRRNARPDEAKIRDWLDGHLCRCTGYHNVVRAVQHVVEQAR